MNEDPLLAEQVRYYRARAEEYDDAYERRGQFDRGDAVNADWRAEHGRMVAALAATDVGHDVLELAAGTGVWTELLVERGARVTAIDASPETLAVNRRRLGARAATVDFVVADLFTWQPPRVWDSCVVFFFLCKVPDDRLAAFLGTCAAAVRPGGTIFVGDKVPRPDGEPGVFSEERTLHDGRTFTVVERPRTVDEHRAAFGPAGFDVEVITFGSRTCAVTGTRR